MEKFVNCRLLNLKGIAIKNNIPFSFTLEDAMEQLNNQNKLCFYTDVPLICKSGNGHALPNSLSFDKIIPEKGYVKNNVVFAANKINTCKNDLSLLEISMWMPSWYERIMKFIKS